MPRPVPFSFQKEDISKISELGGRALISHEMGCGKTAIALWWMSQNKAWPALVVCPASLKWVWESEALKFIGVRAAVLESRSPPTRDPAGLRTHKLLIINYDILKDWVPWLKKRGLKTLIGDEVHYVSNRGSGRSKAFRKMSKEVENVLCLSGTPLTNRPSELWHILHCLRPEQYKGFFPYAQRYCQPKRKPWGMEFKGASNLQELHHRLKTGVMIRRRKADVLKDLPDKSRQVIPFDLSPDKKKDYKQAKDNFLTWLSVNSGIHKAATAQRAEQIVMMGELKKLAARHKLKSVVMWARDWFAEQEDEKMVMFAWHRKALDAIERNIGVPLVRIDGSTSKRKRKLAVEQFQRDDKTKLFLGQMSAAGVGLTLTRSSTVAFAEFAWTPGLHAQAEDRIHRIGQKNAAMIYYLVAKDTIEESLAEIIQKKQETLSAVLDGGSQTEDIDVYSLLAEALKKEA